MKPTKFVIFSPADIEALAEASVLGTYSYTFSEEEINALKEGVKNVSLDLVIKARRVINEVLMRKTVAKTEFVERTELAGYVSQAEFRVLQAHLEAMTAKFFLVYTLLEQQGLISEKDILALSQVVVKNDVKLKRKKK